MDPTCGLVDKIWDLVLDQIWKQLLYLVHYHRNIEQLYGRLDDLISERSSLQHRIDEATNNTDKIEENVLHWLRKVDEISEQVQELHRESEAKLEGGITSCPNPLIRCKLSKRAEAIAQEAAKLCGEGNFVTVAYRGPPQSISELTNRESNEGIDSRVEIKNHIMEALRNPRFNMIGLCGLGGVGKTTIAKDIEKEEKNQKVFEKVIMATVSQEMNIGQIQDQIIEKLGMQLNERTEEVKASRLYRRLENEKKMLLILDDLWQELDLGKVGIPFGDVERNSKINDGCKILLTSRNETLLSKSMKCQKVITVGVLLEDEAWELFQSIAKLSIESSNPDLKSIATEIVQKCGGLPLAIATAAKALKDKNMDGWRDYLARLKHPLARSFTGIKEVDTILKLSYEPLSQEKKHIFLLSAMLSHDPSVEDLLMYSVGLDILKHIQDMGDAGNAIFDIVGKLKSLNLFLDSFSSHHFTMHDVFRDVALSMASEELNAVIVWHRRLNEWPDESDLKCCKGICLQESDICDLPEELHGPILEFFLLNSKKSDLTIPNMFFKSSKELKVLAITNVHFSSLPSLSFLQRLKTLCLHSCLLEDITEIRSLRKLKTLSLAYSEIEWLPAEVAELTSLQMLNLSHCSKLKVIPQKILSSLKKLEVLYMGNSFNQWKVEGSSEANENASLDELKDLPISSLDIHIPNVSMMRENLFLDMNLKRYKISIKKQSKWQENCETSKILKLDLQTSVHLKGGIRKLLEGVEDLYLYGSNAYENVLHSHEGRGFPHLRYLWIDGNLEAATKNVYSKTFKSFFNKNVLFPKLEKLELANLNNGIALIWDDQLSHNSFSNLKRMIVVRCGFVKLVPLHVLKSLNNLEELEVWNCNMLEIVFDFEDLKDDKEVESSSVAVPMKMLRLSSLPKLKNVWSNHHQGNVSFPSLRNVNVWSCESLTSMFPASIAKGMLCDLEKLRIQKCGIDVIVAKDQVLESAVVTFEFPSLTSLELSCLQKLRNFFPHQHTLKLPHLHKLSIEDCDELEISEKEISSTSEIHEEESTQNSKYPLFSHHDEIIQELEKLELRGKQAEMIGSGQYLMYHFPNVKFLCLDVHKATTISYRSLLKSFTKLEDLQLKGNFEKAFGGEDVARFPKLTFWNNSIMRSLSPSLVSFPNLTHLNVRMCSGWTTLMESSAAQSLVHLTRLSVDNCYKMEEIITKQEGENDEDKEIIFRKLESLRLSNLPRLQRFCRHNYTFRFPLLDKLVIASCPKFKIFSSGLIDTPSLKSVQLSQHEIWDTNLNKTFYQQRYVTSRELVLDEDDAIMIWNDQFPVDPCPQVEILRIEGFVEEWVTFPYTLLERFPKLNELHVKNSSFEGMFPSHGPSSISFHNLTVLKVSKCHHLVYVVTCSAVKSLVNLETLEIDECEKLEEIVRNETDEDVERGITLNGLRILKLTRLPKLKTQEDKKDFDIEQRTTNTRCTNISRSLFNHNKVLLSKLETLELSNLLNNLLSVIWDDQHLHNSFSHLKRLIVKSCDYMKLVPFHVLKSLNNLEELEVSHCDKLEMVFGFEDLNDYHKEMESSSVVAPLSLTHLEVKWCHGLTTLMTSSAAASLVHMTHLSISNCNQIEEIIMMQEGEDNEDKEIFFNQMKCMEFNGLPRLKRFCGYNYTFRFPLLEHVAITMCPRLTMFCPGAIHAPLLQSIRVNKYGPHKDIWMTNLNNTIQHLFTFEEVTSTCSCMALNSKNITMITDVFPIVSTLYVESFMDEGVMFPYSSLERFPHLFYLYVEHCSFGEIFPSQDQIIDFKGKISPFKDLWRLSISRCHQLIHLVTTSTAKSLVSLKWLEINDCKKMKEIVKNDTNEDVESGIKFNQLWTIKLTDMPSLKMFSSQSHTLEFQALKEIEISGCPKIKKFCRGVLKTPKLSKVKIEEHDMEWKDEGDLNKIMEGLSLAKDSFNI